MPDDALPPRAASLALLGATAVTLRRLGPRRFSLTAVADAAGVSRGTVHNAFGSRERAIKVALDHLASAFVDTMADEVHRCATLADQVAAAAQLICAHRQRSDHVVPGGINESILVLLLRHSGDDLVHRAIELWQPLAESCPEQRRSRPRRRRQTRRRVDRPHPVQLRTTAPMGVNLDNPRAVRRFVTDHVVSGLTGGTHD